MWGQQSRDIIRVLPIGVQGIQSTTPFFPSFILQYGKNLDQNAIVDPTSGLKSALFHLHRFGGIDVAVKDLKLVVVTHGHIDHAGGLPGQAVMQYWDEWMRKAEENEDGIDHRATLAAPGILLETLRDTALRGTMYETMKSVEPYEGTTVDLDEIFIRRPLNHVGKGVSERVNGLDIIVGEAHHRSFGGAYCYKFCWNEVVVGYSGDTAPGPDGKGIIPFMMDYPRPHFLVHEAGGSAIGGHTDLPWLYENIPKELEGITHIIHYKDSDLDRRSKFKFLHPFHTYDVSRTRVKRHKLPALGRKYFKLMGRRLSNL